MNERQDPTSGTLPCFNSDVQLLSAYHEAAPEAFAIRNHLNIVNTSWRYFGHRLKKDPTKAPAVFAASSTSPPLFYNISTVAVAVKRGDVVYGVWCPEGVHVDLFRQDIACIIVSPEGGASCPEGKSPPGV